MKDDEPHTSGVRGNSRTAGRAVVSVASDGIDQLGAGLGRKAGIKMVEHLPKVQHSSAVDLWPQGDQRAQIRHN